MPSIANPPPSPKRTTLEDAFDARLVAQHPKKLGLTNAGRSNEDQKITSALCATWRLPKQGPKPYWVRALQRRCTRTSCC